ncbi:beta-N-acetylhexosaminidase [Streptomyces sp. NPDC005438]|uniref:beta-N-acetylhexosaminidase n=1 Tax=Streptomyces sp. NPDC005438 TaxID=3156880 RepID=UPI0033A76449
MTVTTQGTSGPSGDAVPSTHVVPAPVSVRPDPSADYLLVPEDSVWATAGSQEARDAAEFLAQLLRVPTGYRLPVEEAPAGDRPRGGVALLLESGGSEGGATPGAYTLDVTPQGVTVVAADREGLFNGVATLRQLLPLRVDSREPVEGPWPVAGGRVEDRPRYPYRGAHLDVARNFMPVENVKRFIDTIARYKINHFHLHLTNDQGWRIEITSRPDLTAIGGATGVGGVSQGHYTQDEYRDLVRFAWERGITLVPEIEGPNHGHAAIASYPELNEDGTAPPPHLGYGPSQQGLAIHHEPTYAFLDEVIGEIAALTPGPYLHIGGDETPHRPSEDLAHYFSRVQEIVQRHGKQLIGWQESAAYLTPSSNITQFWVPGINDEEVLSAAKDGARVIVSPAERAYLDMRYASDKPEYPIGTVWAGTTDLRRAYDWQPEAVLEGLPPSSVLGVESALWTETIYGIDQAEHLAFPRLLAVAEVAWSAPEAKDWDSFTTRLASQGPRLRQAGVNYYRVPEVRWPFGS